MMNKGLLITFEGGEGAGKSSHIEAIEQALRDQGYDVLVVREPGGTRVGEAIREILLSRDNEGMSPRCEIHLYEAARAQIVDEVIKPALERGTIVLCDRFYDSTTAYQGYGRGIDLSVIENLNMSATGGVVPDRTLIVDVPVEVGLARASDDQEPDRLESAPIAFHEAVRQGFLALAEQNPERIRIVDGNRDREIVRSEIEAFVREVLERV